ncbi:MAG: translation initiation factor IF-2, partial [Chlorobiales bacterium]|nr:translation initiation factor IF-2 [Chlorobiales bacterium]
EKTPEESFAETVPEATMEEELSEDVSDTDEEELEGDELTTAIETEEDVEVEQGSDLKSEISRQQSEIGNRFSQVENIGGLKVLGNIQLQKKKRKRKKNFREQAKDLKQEFVPGAEGTPENKDASEAEKAKKAPATAAKAKDATAKETTPVKKTPREEQIERLQQDGAAARGAKKKGKKQIDEKVIDRNIRETMMTMDESSDTSSRQKFRKIRRKEREREQEMAAAAHEAESKIVKITEYASTHELADLLGVTPKEVIEKCFKMGKFITINQRLDRETIELLAMEFSQNVRFVSDVEATEVIEEPDHEEDLASRPPVVTIMGHVDHGKTSLLDYIRNSNVVAGESGGITQHIGAYEVSLENGQKITFLDTPGHEAFTAMRARGAQITDVVILVVAADDNVMPQTIEAINHAKAAGVPIVVAINKIDKPDANPDKIRTQLADFGVLVEEWGGNIQCQEISAKKGIAIRELMDKVLTEAELLELMANHNPTKLARGVVIEAELDKGKGVVTTILVQNGFIKVGQPFVAGSSSGRIRALLDERGKRLEEASPSQPVRVLGFEELPQAGDIFSVMENDRDAREIAQRRKVIRREQEFRHSSRVKLNDIAKQVQEGKIKELRVIIKADTDGSIQALADGLMKVQTPEVKVEVIHRGVGQITETDVLLAAASDAIIIGFRVRPNLNAKRVAEKEEIDVRFYSVIYHVLEDVHDALEGMLSPELQEKITGTVEIREVFRISKIGNVGGCYVLDGKIGRDNRIRLLRDGIQVHEGELESLKRFKEDVKEVPSGFDCGLTLKNYADIKVGDIVEAFETVETKRKLVVS